MAAAAAVVVTLGTSGVARAEEYPESAGWGALAVIANIGYMPVKTIYALVGGLTGGFAYACTGGSYETASSIWEMSLGGTYVLTPSMIRGEDPIYFAGGPPETSAVSDAPAAAPDVRSSGRSEDDLPAS
jgi:hypothetical protein